jgi:fructuronate reductase
VRLSRSTAPTAGPAWPTRAVHLGPGAFFRAHQAWCTSVAGDGWGIAAVGRSAPSVTDLGEQDGLCSLLVRAPGGDRVELVRSVSEVATLAGLPGLLRDPSVAVVTLTITEAGYAPGSPVLTALAAALEERMSVTGGAPLSVVPCDNLAAAGRVVAERLLAAAPGLAEPAATGGLAFVSTVVDRITPAATDADRAAAAALLGLDDEAAVVTEPAFEWVIEDRFPGGRPAWERGGAQLVADPAPWSIRKLRVLNAAHSLLAYAGGASGYAHVHEAAADTALMAGVTALWDEATAWMPGDAAALVDEAYRRGLLARWSNARLPHRLAQIAANGSAKLTQRVVPTLLAAGAAAPASAEVVGAWVAHLRGATPFAVHDARAGELAPVRDAGSILEAARRALAVLAPELADAAGLAAVVAEAADRYRSR